MTEERTIRCAIYTRKSNAEGLEKEFNSLDAQREAGEKYIESQRGEGYVVLPEHYDDGGFTGGNTERPALKKLMDDITTGKIDCVVVYKVDRLSRSLLDFSKLMEVFDANKVSFISVTQHFNTQNSMGRLTLNILLSFAQFEREVIGERIRDKIAMQKQRGQHCGGTPVLGYDVIHHKLVVNDAEAALVRDIFKQFIRCGSMTQIVRKLNADGHRTKTWTTVKGRHREGHQFTKSHLYRILHNRVYLGEINHKGTIHQGEHMAIIDQTMWARAHDILKISPRVRTNVQRRKSPHILRGILRCGPCQRAMIPTYTVRRGREYSYYVCGHASKNGHDACTVKTIPAPLIEQEVMRRVLPLLDSPGVMAQAFDVLRAENPNCDMHLAARALHDVRELWDSLHVKEKARILQLLVERIEAFPDGLRVTLRNNGLVAVMREMADH